MSESTLTEKSDFQEEQVVEGDAEKNNSVHENEEVKPKLEGEELLDSLKKQIEFYFSKENLVNDRYLLSQMDEEMYVPVEVIAGFKMVKNLTEDSSLLIQAMKKSKIVSLNDDETKVKPNAKAQRNTIFLREIPSSSDLEDIKGLFSDKFDDFETKADIGDCWYITFPDDNIALSALEHVRNKTFQGKPIRARIKTETSLKSFQLAAATTSADQKTMYNVDYTAYMGNNAQSANWNMGYGYPGWENQDPNLISGGQRFEGKRGGYRRSRKDFGGRGRGYRGGRDSRKKRGSGKGNIPQQVPNLGTAHFPPLVPSGQAKTTFGYSSDFIKYSREEIIEVVSSIKDVTKPKDMDDKRAELVVLSEPNYEVEVTKPFPKKIDKPKEQEKATSEATD